MTLSQRLKTGSGENRELDPFTVECPRCGAQPRCGCISKSAKGTFGARTHIARWSAIGIHKPSEEQRSAALSLLRKYESNRFSELYT